MTTKALRATVSLAGIEVEAFQLPSGEYAMSQTQVAEIVEMNKMSMSRFLTKKETQALLGEGFRCNKLSIEGNNKPINAVPIDVALMFWGEQADNGNSKALAIILACAKETLERRFDRVFNVSKSEQQYEQQTANWLEKWLPVRQYLAEQHAGFCRACHDYGFPPAKTHDRLAIAACGMPAKELKKLEKVCGDKNIGLNHIEDIGILKRFARVKYFFSSFKKGDIENRIARALEKVRKEEKTLKVTSNN
jgi:hypothetical protein